MKKLLTVGAFALWIAVFVFTGCKPEDPPTKPDTTATDTLTLTRPTGGETFSVGETVTIAWTADREIAPAIGIRLSTDGGQTWNEISGGAIEDPNVNQFDWVPTADQASTQCVIWIYEYQNEYAIMDKSDMFTVQ